jgi:hypothetical protein
MERRDHELYGSIQPELEFLDFQGAQESIPIPKEPIPPGCVTWRAGTTMIILFFPGSLASIDCLKIPARFPICTRDDPKSRVKV